MRWKTIPMATRRVYLVYDGILSSVFDSQVLTPLRRVQDLGLAHDLIAFSSCRSLVCAARYREKCQQVREQVAGRTFFFRTMPYLGQSSLVYPALRLRAAVGKLGLRDDDLIILHARGHQASHMALGLRSLYPRLGVIANLRGLAAREVSTYKRLGGRIDYLLTGGRQAIALDKVEAAIVQDADSLICVSNAFKRYLVTRYGLPEDRVEVIPTAVDTDTFRFDHRARERVRRSLGIASKLVVAYSGSAHEWEVPDHILRAFRMVAGRRRDSHLLILTTQPAELERAVARAGVPTEAVHVLSVQHRLVPQYLSAADVGLLIREDNLVNRVAAPTKFAEYLACGVPVLVSKGIGDTEAVISSYDVGWVTRDLSDTSLTDAVRRIEGDIARIASPGFKQHCAAVAQKLYSWESHIPTLLGLYQRLESADGCQGGTLPG